MYNSRPTVMEVDLSSFKFNISQIQKYVGKEIKIIPVIKANAYGTYINTQLDIINEFEIVAVALISEGIELRKIGYKKDILVLNQPSIDEIQDIIDNNITIGISSKEFLNYIILNNKKIKVHIEIETGMNRTGVDLKDLDEFINKLKNYKNIDVQGIYSHLSSADNDDEYTKEQIEKFEIARKKVQANFNTIKYIHLSSSNGILKYPSSYYNAVRPGIILYGYESFEGAKNIINIKPVCKLKSKITFLKEVPKNTAIGYSKTYITKNDKTLIATVPLGYADGLKRSYSNNGYVVINNVKAPIVGSICMDSIMVDATNIPNVKVGSTVYIWDNKNILVDDIAKSTHTINYEIISLVSNRVPRYFI